MRRAAAGLVAVALLCLAVAGCGESASDSGGAPPTVFVTAPLCEGARTAYRADPRPGGEVLGVVCLGRSSGSRLAAIGAGARRASESSATIAYVGEPDRRSVDFSAPILDAAGIGAVSGSDGAAAMREVLRAVAAGAGDDDLRAAVREQLEAG